MVYFLCKNCNSPPPFVCCLYGHQKTVIKTIPYCFKSKYPTARIILYCTELFIETPTSYRSQSATFWSYKHHDTAKGLLGISQNGAITFVSDLNVGRFSDRKITKDSGIYDLVEPDDSIMADRGFTLEDDLYLKVFHLTSHNF